jgi:hypothetical protein
VANELEVINTASNAGSGSGTAGVPFTATAPAAPGVTILGMDGRAVFDGGGGTVVALGSSGASSPGRWVGPQGPLPSTELPGRGSERGASRLTGDSTAGQEAPAPRRADLLTDFLPYDRAALEQAIDRFLARCDDLGATLSGRDGPPDLLTEIMAVAVAFTAAKVGLRLFWRARDDEAASEEAALCLDLDPFPGAVDI